MLFAGISPVGAKTRAGFSHSSASFDVNTRSALIWVRGEQEGQLVQVEWCAEGAFTSSIFTAPVQLSKDRDLTHTFDIGGLDPDTIYFYRPVSSVGHRTFVGETGRFRTAPESTRTITFTISGDTLALYKPFRLFDTMLARKPEFFINLGDVIYADHPNPKKFHPSLAHYRYKHAENRDDDHMQAFMSAIPTFAIWDDHEVQNNFDSTHPFLPVGRQAFLEWWPRRADTPSQLYRRFSWGPLVEFFLLDTRQYRSLSNARNDATKTMLGADQKAWLMDGLLTSTAPLKIILSPSPFNGKTGKDGWSGYPDERKELDEFIAKHHVRRVFVISGDWHMAIDMSKVSTEVDEVVVGPIAAWPKFQMNPRSIRDFEKSKRPHVGDAFNFAHGRIEATPNGARLTLDIVDIDGNVRFSKIVES